MTLEAGYLARLSISNERQTDGAKDRKDEKERSQPSRCASDIDIDPYLWPCLIILVDINSAQLAHADASS